MTHYVVFTIDSDGHFTAVRDVWAASHAEAMEQARSMLDQFILELWCKGQWIATLAANAASREEGTDGLGSDEPASHSGLAAALREETLTNGPEAPLAPLPLERHLEELTSE